MKPQPTKKMMSEAKRYLADRRIAQFLIASIPLGQGTMEQTTSETLIEITGTDENAVWAVLRELEELGWGRYLRGRRGFKTRIEWAADPRKLVELAASMVGTSPTKIPDGESVRLISSGREVIIPKDMTDLEMRDLYLWLSSRLM